MKKEFKYKSRFNILAGKPKPFDKFGKNTLVASSNLEELSGLFPDKEIVEGNPDLLYSSFNAAVINLINDNDDGIMTDTALRIGKHFEDKHMNIEHMRHAVVGHIINHGFSSFGENKLLKPSDLEGTNSPFNLSLASVVYKVIDEYFAEDLESRAQWSASWELGFDEFHIALGSKNLSKAEIITKDSQVKEFSEHLRSYGGAGFTKDGVEVYRVVVGDVLPLGCAFTESPAAAVEGHILANTEKKEEKPNQNQNEQQEEPSEQEVLANNQERIIIKNQENISQNQKQRVTTTRKTYSMKIQNIDDIQQDKLEEIEASSIRDFIKEKLEEANSNFSAEKQQLEAKIQEEEDAKAEEAQAAVDAQKALDDLKKELEDLKANNEKVAKQNAFNERMSALDEEYALEDHQRTVIAKQIKELDESGFADWKVGFDAFATKKADLQDQEQEQEQEEDLESELEQANASASASIPNGIQTQATDYRSKYKDSFDPTKGGVTFSKR